MTDMNMKATILFFYSVVFFIATRILSDERLSARQMKVIYFAIGVISTLVVYLIFAYDPYSFRHYRFLG